MARARAAKVKPVRAVERAFEILECFTPDKASLGITEIEKRVRLSRPTLYRMLHTLVIKGYVSQHGDPARYQLAAGAARLADVWYASLDVSQYATPFLHDLWLELDETASLFVRQGDRRLCVKELASRQVLSFSRGVGYADHLTLGASGLAILAHLPGEEISEIVASAPEDGKRRPLQRRLDEIRSEGFAITKGERILGAVGIAAAFFDRAGEVIGSVGIFGPEVRFGMKRSAECAAAVKRCAAQLSRGLGFASGSPTAARVRSKQRLLASKA